MSVRASEDKVMRGQKTKTRCPVCRAWYRQDWKDPIACPHCDGEYTHEELECIPLDADDVDDYDIIEPALNKLEQVT